MSLSTEDNPEEESAELRRFREEWKHEVRQRRGEQSTQHPGIATSNPERVHHKPSSTENHHAKSSTFHPQASPPKTQGELQSVSSALHQSLHASHGNEGLSGTIARAVQVYRSAVQHEQQSDLDNALRLYRQAFRLNPDVDRAYFREEQRLQQLDRSTVSTGHKTASTGKAEAEVKDSHVTAESKGSLHTDRILSRVLENFPRVLTFEAEDDRQGVPINIIPEELLLSILRNLDTSTLERFAIVSRKARVLSLDSSIWRDIVCLVYKPPQIPETATVQTIVNGYGSNYRQTYIEHPRLRLDGVYIAVCHYVWMTLTKSRRGLGENAWANVSHLITYHRYLRFFPDGKVLSLLANEEHQPALVIPILKPSLRMKGFHIGAWRLEGSSVVITDLVERHPQPPQVTHAHHQHVPQSTRYHFQMMLTLRSKPLGRWNKLDFVSYESVNIEDGEVVPLPLKHDRPFWFSKVKSWQGY